MPDTPLTTLMSRSDVEGHVADLADLADARSTEIYEASCALIDDYAIGAPDAIRKLALTRLVAWLMQESPGLRSEAVGDIRVQRTPSTDGLYHSGASALLTKWRVRRGGVV